MIDSLSYNEIKCLVELDVSLLIIFLMNANNTWTKVYKRLSVFHEHFLTMQERKLTFSCRYGIPKEKDG